MKKLFLLFFVLVTVSNLFAFEKYYDFVELDLNAIVADKSNKLSDGYVIQSGSTYYYREDITYTINCNKKNISDSYMFFKCSNKDTLTSFFEDYIQEYINRSYKFFWKSNFINDDLQIAYYFYMNKKPMVAVYGKIDMENGLRGFGVAYEEDIEEIISRSDELEYVEYEDNRYYDFKNYTNEKPFELDVNTVYFNGYEFNTEGKLSLAYNINNYQRFSIYEDNCILNTNGEDYCIKLVCEDESLLDEPLFLGLEVVVNESDCYSFQKLMKYSGSYIIGTKEVSKFSIWGIFFEEDEIKFINSIADKFYIEITPKEP